METAGACFERCPGQAPAGVLMLWQLEAATEVIVAQSLMGTFFAAKGQRVTLPTQPMVPHGGGCQLSDRRQKTGPPK